MVEDKILVLLEGELVLLVLFTVWKVNATQLGLNQEGDFMGWKCNVDFDGEPNTIGTVNLFV